MMRHQTWLLRLLLLLLDPSDCGYLHPVFSVVDAPLRSSGVFLVHITVLCVSVTNESIPSYVNGRLFVQKAN